MADHRAAHPQVCLNLSARQLLAPNLAATLVRLCQSHGVPPERLEVEITEHTLMGDVDQATAALRELRQAGISASLDDFGSGQASMAYLMQAPISTLKIDKSFVWALGAVPTATAVIRASSGWLIRWACARWPKAWRPRRSARCCRTRAATRCRAICSAAPAPGRLRRDDRRRDRRRHSGQG